MKAFIFILIGSFYSLAYGITLNCIKPLTDKIRHGYITTYPRPLISEYFETNCGSEPCTYNGNTYLDNNIKVCDEVIHSECTFKENQTNNTYQFTATCFNAGVELKFDLDASNNGTLTCKMKTGLVHQVDFGSCVVE